MHFLVLALCVFVASSLKFNPLKIIEKKSSIAVLSLAILTQPSLTQAAGAPSASNVFINSLATVIEAREVLKPVVGFVDVQAYDNARTNIKYTVNQLRLQKTLDALVQNSLDFSDDADAIDAAADASTRIANTAQQLDSTVYTLVFIPSEDGIPPPSAEKYVKQSKDFYGTLDSDLSVMLKVASAKQLGEAQLIAEKSLKEMPDFLFKTPKRKLPAL